MTPSLPGVLGRQKGDVIRQPLYLRCKAKISRGPAGRSPDTPGGVQVEFIARRAETNKNSVSPFAAVPIVSFQSARLGTEFVYAAR